VTDRLVVSGIRVFARHGVLSREAEEGQDFLIDVDLGLDTRLAGGSDALGDTVDYGRLAQAVHERVAGERWNLIERVAERVAELCLADARVNSVTVTVHKPGAPLAVSFDDVSVSVTRQR